MVAVTSTVPAGCLIHFMLVDLSLGDTGQYFMVVLELLFLVTPRCVVLFLLLSMVI
jgi:hypothetical protein